MAHHNAVVIVWFKSGQQVVVPCDTLQSGLQQALRGVDTYSVSKIELFTQFEVGNQADSKVVAYLETLGMADKLP